jgi:hypothetical protein
MVDTYERELTSYAEEQGKTKFIKEYESAKRRGNGEKDLKEEVHNVIYDNSDMVNTKIKEVQKVQPMPIRRNSQELVEDGESDSEDSVYSEESTANHPDEYEEFRKKFDDSGSETE